MKERQDPKHASQHENKMKKHQKKTQFKMRTGNVSRKKGRRERISSEKETTDGEVSLLADNI